MNLSKDEYAAILKSRVIRDGKLGSGKPKPPPMKRKTVVKEVTQDLFADDRPDFGLEAADQTGEHDGLRSENFFVQYMAPSLNAIYAGIHWTKRNKHADEGHQACSGLQIVPFSKPVKITFVPIVGKRAKARDCSNYAYAAKIVEDGLVEAKIIKDDTNEYVKAITIEEPIIDRSIESGMWVHIQEVGEWCGQRWLEEEYPWRNVS